MPNKLKKFCDKHEVAITFTGLGLIIIGLTTFSVIMLVKSQTLTEEEWAQVQEYAAALDAEAAQLKLSKQSRK